MHPDRRKLLTLAVALSASRAFAQKPTKSSPAPWPRAASVPGGVARVPLGAGDAAPQAWLGEQRVLVMREREGWAAWVGIALAEKAGSVLTLTVQYPNNARAPRTIKVGAKSYASQRLKVQPDKVEVKAMAMLMEGGFGADIDFVAKELVKAGVSPSPDRRVFRTY